MPQRVPLDADREAVAAVVASIHTQTNDIVELAKRLPTLSPKRDEGYTPLDPNDYIDEIADRIQAQEPVVGHQGIESDPERAGLGNPMSL